jgi:hypothetical protein
MVQRPTVWVILLGGVMDATVILAAPDMQSPQRKSRSCASVEIVADGEAKVLNRKPN